MAIIDKISVGGTTYDLPGSGTTYTAGSGIDITNNTIGVKVDNSTIIVDNNGTISSLGSGGTHVTDNQALLTNANLSDIRGETRGTGSVDLQTIRNSSKDVCSGDNSFLFGKNSSALTNDGFCFGTGTRFDVDGAIQTNQNFTSYPTWSGHTGIIGKSFENTDAYTNIELFRLDTGTAVTMDVQSIFVVNNSIYIENMEINVCRGFLTYSRGSSPMSYGYGWFPELSNNIIYLYANTNISNIQLGIRYTIFGESQGEGSSLS